MKPPAYFARQVEEHPTVPPGDGECVSGYGVMGLPFTSGHVLGLRRWTASSIGPGFTSIWYRTPSGRWTFYETVEGECGCTRYFGADVDRVEVGPIDLAWDTPNRIHVRTADAAVDWTIETGSTVTTRLMSTFGALTPAVAWRSPTALAAMGSVAGRVLRAGKLQLTGRTSNAQHFDANPRRIWYVTASRAVVDGVDLGPPGPLPEQARMADFSFPQRGILAVGSVFVTPLPIGVRPGARRTADGVPGRGRR